MVRLEAYTSALSGATILRVVKPTNPKNRISKTIFRISHETMKMLCFFQKENACS
jgi:hypothetical protein